MGGLLSVNALSPIRPTLLTAFLLIMALLLSYGQLIAQGKIVEDLNKQLIHIAIEEIANKGNLDKIADLCTEDFVRHFLPDGSQTEGLPDFKSQMAHLRMAFPDWVEDIKLMALEDDMVAVWMIASGTNTASFLNNLPTGKKTVHDVVSFFRIADGKIAEQWLLPDLYSIYYHLGLIPGQEATENNAEVISEVLEPDLEIDSIELKRNKDLALLANKEVWTNGNFERLDKMFSDDFVQHFLPFGTHIDGLELFRKKCIAHRNAFPDWSEVVNLIVSEGNYVFIQYTSTGTNTGHFLGKPPTGKPIHIDEVTIFSITKGKIAEQWLLPDILSLNQQLGSTASSD